MSKMAAKRKRNGAARRAMKAEAEEERSGDVDGVKENEESVKEVVEGGPEVAGRGSEAPVNEGTLNDEDESVEEATEKLDKAEEEEEEKNDGNDAAEQAKRREDVEEEEEEPDEEEIVVVLELADFKNHPILDDYRSITIEGIDTPQPTLHVGEYSLHGQMEETVGTHYFYDTKNRTEANEYRYTGQTTKKIKFTIAPPDEF